MRFLLIPRGRYRIGTTWAGIQACANEWRLKKSKDLDLKQYAEWIEKEFPDHWVETEDYFLQEAPVTNAQVRLYLEQNPSVKVPESTLAKGEDDHPLWGISRDWALAFAEWLSKKAEKYKFRLPTETEWEIAARGPDFREYPYGKVFNPRAANTFEAGLGRTTKVTHFQDYPGPFGHLDLAGNVEEWVASNYVVYPGGRIIYDSFYENLGPDYPVLRGGNFLCAGDLSRSARRHGPLSEPNFRYTGFRLVREEV